MLKTPCDGIKVWGSLIGGVSTPAYTGQQYAKDAEIALKGKPAK